MRSFQHEAQSVDAASGDTSPPSRAGAPPSSCRSPPTVCPPSAEISKITLADAEESVEEGAPAVAAILTVAVDDDEDAEDEEEDREEAADCVSPNGISERRAAASPHLCREISESSCAVDHWNIEKRRACMIDTADHVTTRIEGPRKHERDEDAGIRRKQELRALASCGKNGLLGQRVCSRVVTRWGERRQS